MNYNKLDKIIEKFIKNNEFYIRTLPMVTELSKQILLKQQKNINGNIYRKIEIDQSIGIVYSFLKTIDINMANIFFKYLFSNNKTINILPKKQFQNGQNKVDTEGNVYIFYENTMKDPFIILHEMLHKMNYNKKINEKLEKSETITRDYFGELVSITGEMMLGNYMVENGFITKEEMYLRMQKRIETTKEDARNIIIESTLIKLKMEGKKITNKNLLDELNKYETSSLEYKILNDEKNDMKRIQMILKNNDLILPKSQRYVIALALSEELLKRDTLNDDFVKLHYALEDENSNIEEVYNEIKPAHK